MSIQRASLSCRAEEGVPPCALTTPKDGGGGLSQRQSCALVDCGCFMKGRDVSDCWHWRIRFQGVQGTKPCSPWVRRSGRSVDSAQSVVDRHRHPHPDSYLEREVWYSSQGSQHLLRNGTTVGVKPASRHFHKWESPAVDSTAHAHDLSEEGWGGLT